MVPSIVDMITVRQVVAAIERIERNISRLSPKQRSNLVMERQLPASKRGGIPAEDTGDAVFIIGDPPAFDPVFAHLIVYPGIVSFVQRLLETPEIRHHFSNVTMKSPRVGSGISWHRDFPNQYVCPKTPSFLRVMICLDAMDAENGATQLIAGSHRAADTEAAADFVAKDGRYAGAVLEIAECPPGSLVMIHPMTVHGGGPNRSNRYRRALIVQWGIARDPIVVSNGDAETLAQMAPGDIERWVLRQLDARAGDAEGGPRSSFLRSPM